MFKSLQSSPFSDSKYFYQQASVNNPPPHPTEKNEIKVTWVWPLYCNPSENFIILKSSSLQKIQDDPAVCCDTWSQFL